MFLNCPNSTGCDQEVTTAGTVVNYPGSDVMYGNNEDCVTSIYNEAGCISLIFLDIDIQPGTVAGICDRDYLEVCINEDCVTSIYNEGVCISLILILILNLVLWQPFVIGIT